MAEAIIGPLLSKLQEVAVAEAKALAGVSGEIERLRGKLMWLHAVVHETDLRRRQEGNQLVRVLACQMREICFEAEDAIDRFYLQADLSRRDDWRRAVADFLANFGTQIRVRAALSRKIRSMNARLEDIVDNSAKFSTGQGGGGGADNGGRNLTWRASRNIPHLRLDWDDDMEVPYRFDRPTVPMEGTPGLKAGQKKGGKLIDKPLPVPGENIPSVDEGVSPIMMDKDVLHQSPGVKQAGSSHKEESTTHLTGRKTQEDDLEKYLLDKESHDVICIVGESGIGKRALVRSVCGKAAVRKHFKECISWESFPPDTSNPSNIVHQISNKLKGLGQDRHLLVLDIPMSTSLWNRIRRILPERGGNGSKIVLTATSWHHQKHIIFIQLRCLDKAKSTTLFNKKIDLKGRRKSAYKTEKMDKVRDDIEELTGGLPLAVVLLAKLLRTMDLNKWKRASKYLMTNNQDDRLKTVVSLGVDDLPDDLKSCLLYTAGFPKRCVIDAHHLVRLWEAEGFLTPQHGVEPKELGQRYLKELIFRGLVQLVKKHGPGDIDGVELVAVHERIHPFFRLEAQHTGFMDIQCGGPDTARRLALWNFGPRFPEFVRSFKKLRTIVSRNFDCEGTADSASKGQEHQKYDQSTILCAPSIVPLVVMRNPIKKKVPKVDPHFLQLLRGSPFLRVVDLEGVDIGEALPGEIGDMVHMQYLGVRGCLSLKTVPSSVGKLSKLQTLDVRGTCVTVLPRSLWKVTTLRHVLGHKLVFPISSGDLKLIRTVQEVVINGVSSSERRKWLGLRPLRQLHVVELNESNAKDLATVLEQLTFLEDLSLSGETIPAVVFNLASHVVSLELNGTLNMYPDSLNLLLTQHLVLSSTHIGQKFIDKLAELPVLAELAMLDDAYDSEKLVFHADSFSSLTVLRLSRLAKLKTIKEKGDAALEKLTTFQMIGMPADLSLEGATRLGSIISSASNL